MYDITDDLERARVDKVLKGFGFRIQKSVFECRLDRKNRDELIKKLNALNIQTGFIKIYRLEYSYKSNIIGVKDTDDIDDGYVFVV
ncbi:CRISPR-associated endonuclease Cas2 [hot springs metagenome]|uniref:CRISPR-associated endonuclease Cas2 n=1 Tax=hot springs metagenome TaxID=433727 RepID=A0A5J4L289_9ZZZZ